MGKALVIDDSLLIRKAVSNMLSPEGFECDMAEDGEEGWEMFQQDSYDLCVVDLIMPKVDGVELIRRIREQDTTVPILVVTSAADPHYIKKAAQAGASDYLIKPLRKEQFLETLEGVLRSRPAAAVKT